ncbi:hypothetical protein JQC72_15045 [Polycladomyces sp. WAk]|uniref:Uncharacterized protein n=1 Tax=Polycladomyces zharkentensis TaxID=2807616 RepID=A0ABS2WN50_9BACL|nr:hypothetical protein [Polycladomyces sp. WAk]MBN2910814.1 hypothetical protein [Polycladomyces sp. WAk]
MGNRLQGDELVMVSIDGIRVIVLGDIDESLLFENGDGKIVGIGVTENECRDVRDALNQFNTPPGSSTFQQLPEMQRKSGNPK